LVVRFGPLTRNLVELVPWSIAATSGSICAALLEDPGLEPLSDFPVIPSRVPQEKGRDHGAAVLRNRPKITEPLFAQPSDDDQ
ncbi:hypothetical protein GOODEAATRI_028976, partial [Goodea atripinnis]